MQISTKANLAPRSALTKPLLATALATGAAGMAAFAAPLIAVPASSPAQRSMALLAPLTAQAPRAKVQATIRFQLPPPTIMPATAADRGGLHASTSADLPREIADEAEFAPSSASRIEPLSSRDAMAAPEATMPAPPPVELSLPKRTQPALVGPVARAPADAEPLAMPSAELKAMMASVAATRGDLAPARDAKADAGPTSRVADMAALALDDGQAAEPQPGVLGDEGQGAIGRYSQTERGIEFEVAAVVNGAPAGKVPLLIADGENISVRLGDVLALIEPLMDKAQYDSLSAAKSAGEFVTFNSLRQSGIAVKFDSKDRLILGKS